MRNEADYHFFPGAVTNRYNHFLTHHRSEEILGTLRSDDGGGNGNATKAIGLITKTTILHVHHAFLYISLPSLHDYDVKMPNSQVVHRKYTSYDEISSLFLNLNTVVRNSPLGGFVYISQS